jgi:hypothetical protein
MTCVWHIVEKVVEYSPSAGPAPTRASPPSCNTSTSPPVRKQLLLLLWSLKNNHILRRLWFLVRRWKGTPSYGGGQLQHNERVLADGVAARGHAAFRFTIYGGNPNLHERESPLVQKRKQSHSIHHVNLGDAVLFEKSVVVENGGKGGGERKAGR